MSVPIRLRRCLAFFWEFEERGWWKAMDEDISDLIEAHYVRYFDGPASGGSFTDLVILIPVAEGRPPARRRFVLTEMKQFREHWSMGDGGIAAWSVVAVKNIRRVTVMENIRRPRAPPPPLPLASGGS